MLSKLRNSPALHPLLVGLVLLLTLSQAAANGTCASADAAPMSPAMAAHADHDHPSGTADDCSDPVCQATCASTAAVTVPETVPAASVRPAGTGATPATAPRTGHPDSLLRPPLSS